ncbi:MAG TPA: transcriptional regulator GcvA [Candidatus Thiothrix moscowensis]|uniref:transcriptional regulator GcvA n=1 Tax=unclassified Thiothrix TaxID=2636184 RepID=UPI0025F00695|nr:MULTISPECIES: transcriptional regulator GcvA [unclassified Thiothrix]HRJ53376.1 transcriptional regulator GcvA [Candidatus Thiothrix moscowensis]HRJ94647.1 transcriptional regulator GcvA [Candidatus Thiothrix moscowensis]
MSQQLPPLNALRAFEAVARHLSFTKAAAELNVTRAAISHQIKYLEDFLGFALIERNNRAVTLSAGAEAALPKLRTGFDCLAEAVSLMRGSRAGESITVWAAPSFAAKWLVPRLHRFSQRYPDVDMQISSDAGLVDSDLPQDKHLMDASFRQHGVDVMIRFGLNQLGDSREEKLFPVWAVPLCSPLLISDRHPHPLRTPADLVYHTLLHDDTAYAGHPHWLTWLALQGVEGVKANRGLHFNQVSLALDAAGDGQGVLLSLQHLAQLDIDAGKLCIPFNLPMRLDQAYYVLRRKQTESRPAVDAFVAWLKEEANAQLVKHG